jgi:lipopolysaccharide export system protein LptA
MEQSSVLEDDMTVKLSTALIACIALFVSACGTSPQNLILGKWEVENAPMKMTAEFSPDGTAKITMLGQTVQGTYKLDAANELVWTVNGITTKGKANITATELELTTDSNQTIKYKRM